MVRRGRSRRDRGIAVGRCTDTGRVDRGEPHTMERDEAISLFPRSECDEDAPANDTSATELVRDVPDERSSEEDEACGGCGGERKALCVRRRGSTQTEAGDGGESTREKGRKRSLRCKLTTDLLRRYIRRKKETDAARTGARERPRFITPTTRRIRVSHADTTKCNIGISKATVCVRYMAYISVRTLTFKDLA